MLNELADRKLRSSRSKSFFSSSFRHVLDSFSSNSSRILVFSSFQQSQSDVLSSRELLSILSSKCSKTEKNKYVIYDSAYHDVVVQ